jgi:hypothetical protein
MEDRQGGKAMQDIVITEENIEEWKKEAEKLDQRIKQDRMKLQLIRRQLEAVNLFRRRIDKTFEDDESTETPFEDLSPADAILAVLSKAEEGTMSAGEIRGKVIGTGYPQERWGRGFAYFYTVLKRLVDAGTLGKEGDRYSYP